MKVLSRINPNEGYHRVVITRSSSDEPVISGLSVTPSFGLIRDKTFITNYSNRGTTTREIGNWAVQSK